MKKLVYFLCFIIVAYHSDAQHLNKYRLSREPLKLKQDSITKLKSILPLNFATCDYGFFCKQELRLEKKINVPIKFRLGSMDYVNWLEGKTILNPTVK